MDNTRLRAGVEKTVALQMLLELQLPPSLPTIAQQEQLELCSPILGKT